MYNNSAKSGGRKPSSRFGSASGNGGFRGGRSGGSSFGSRNNGSRSFSANRFRGPGRGFSGQRRRGGGGFSKSIDPAKFINKAVITEEIENFVPEHKFMDFKIEEPLKRAVVEKGYTDPTPIQDRAIPHILDGADVFGIANTGTGKTAAFLIPLINKVLLGKDEQIMVIAPTRELAIQIDQELKGFVKGMKIHSVCCSGGLPIGAQIRELRFFNNFIIGTPGRIKDLVDKGRIVLSEFKTIVLDEADRMLDMGFVNDMRFIMDKMAKQRQTLFFSATLTPEIETLTKEFLKNPVRISVKNRDTSKNVDQDVVRVGRGNDKLEVLHALLSNEEFDKVLIFGKTKHGVEKLSQVLVQKGFKADSIHGDKNHFKRQRALNLFKDSHVQILVATDVAARGLDIADISHVINFDIPATYEDYVHRIGRTGRGDKKGKALTFVE
ncbi:MAG: DNA/RNA helicase [Parcubacteria group bacterium CG11_big_fil_rev_8_21_14_0_20_39_22]|nr:MAG: DNA/RNA helicase [Parcubacteria group bacterium CG11_big_fil_rev_8_21_14_0_20_39_22]